MSGLLMSSDPNSLSAPLSGLILEDKEEDRQMTTDENDRNADWPPKKLKFQDPFDYFRYFKPLVQLEFNEEMSAKRHNSSDSSSDEDYCESVSFDRICSALSLFASSSPPIADEIKTKLLGHNLIQMKRITIFSLPEHLSAPNLPELNESQACAVRYSLQSSLSLIQGPPGTGKTVTSATIVYHLVKNFRKPILVCAQSNTAVDQLTEKIQKTGVRVVRVYSRKREGSQVLMESVALHKLVLKSNSDLRRFQEFKDKHKGEDLKRFNAKYEDFEKKFRHLKWRYERLVLMSAEVICCTCVGAGDSRLRGIRFQSVLIDESMQATEPECLVPIMMGRDQLILVGDHKQLGPVVKNKEADQRGLSQSLFERLVSLGVKTRRLETQYRMHPSLMEFPSAKFYDNSLENGICSDDRNLNQLSNFWPNPVRPMFFYCCWGQEMAKNYSFLNKREADYVHKIVSLFLKQGIKAEQIGVITPYEEQRKYIANYLKECFHPEMEVSSVNGFQGREKDLIIFSCVRSNKQQTIGFLNDKRRMNVALTRARYGLIVIGNPKVLMKDLLWNDLLLFFKNNHLFMDNPLFDLKESPFQLFN